MLVALLPPGHMIWGISGFMNGSGTPGEGHRHRLRRRDGGAHELRLVRADPVHDPGAAGRLRPGKDDAAQHGALHGGHGDALGRLVRLQRRFRRGRDGIAAGAFTATTLATAVACFTWGMTERCCAGTPPSSAFVPARWRAWWSSPRGRLRERDRSGPDRRLRRGRALFLRHEIQGLVRL